MGGLDEYLLGEKAGRLKELGMGGWKLRWRIMQTERVKERFRRQREALGLPPKEDELLASDGQVVSAQQIGAEIAEFDADLEKGNEVEVGEELEAEQGFMHEEGGRQEKVVL